MAGFAAMADFVAIATPGGFQSGGFESGGFE
jgi:hypothetical protein